MTLCKLLFMVICFAGLLTTCISVHPPEKGFFATLEVENASLFEIQHLYAKLENENDWGPDLLKGKTIPPGERVKVEISEGMFQLKAEISVKNKLISVKEDIKITPGKSYEWTISQDVWLGQGASYDYLNTYGYTDTYGYTQ